MASSTIKSARRVIEILEYFDRERRPLGLTEICGALEYPLSSGTGMLKSLVVLGYLEYDRSNRTYLPTMRVAMLGRWVAEQSLSGSRMLPLMEELRERTRETVMLGAQNDTRVLYVHVLGSPQPLNYSPEPGSLHPLVRSCIGLALLSTKPDSDIDVLVTRNNQKESDRRSHVALKDIREKVSAIRHQGYIFSRQLGAEGVGMVAMPLPTDPFDRIFAIALGGPAERLEKHLAANVAVMNSAIKRFLPRPRRRAD